MTRATHMTFGIFAATFLHVTAMASVGDLRARESPAPSQTTSAAPPSRTVWAGVFTEAQEKRGEAVYTRECSTCHGETLKGGEGSPALVGADFIASWNGQTVADLFETIRLTMPAPPEQPGKLTAQQYADVVAHILKANGFPAGSAELATDAGLMRSIRIAATR